MTDIVHGRSSGIDAASRFEPPDFAPQRRGEATIVGSTARPKHRANEHRACPDAFKPLEICAPTVSPQRMARTFVSFRQERYDITAGTSEAGNPGRQRSKFDPHTPGSPTIELNAVLSCSGSARMPGCSARSTSARSLLRPICHERAAALENPVQAPAVQMACPGCLIVHDIPPGLAAASRSGSDAIRSSVLTVHRAKAGRTPPKVLRRVSGERCKSSLHAISFNGSRHPLRGSCDSCARPRPTSCGVRPFIA